jgi:L-serine dehydratase
MNIPSAEFLLDEAIRNSQPLWQVILAQEAEETGERVDALRRRVLDTYQAMKNAAAGGISSELRSVSGLTGGDAVKYYQHFKNHKHLLGGLAARAMAYALGTAGYNAAMGVIVAAPTAGAAGILPGVVIAAQETYSLSDYEAVSALIVAAGVGAVIMTRATVSGAVGGCQAECGSGAAMAAAALAAMSGGAPRHCIHAAALALKNTLGLACDPVAGLVEVPCVKRNGVFACLAIAAADMALAGIESFIPLDEVIDAMYQIGVNMPASLKETAEGGLATTPTGLAAKRKLF